ncbi:hypothetical protein ABS767_09225 [Sphingomonas sp. ST-64]|uniref:Uncharacterized protein n=1 Tax=Sphingomonas plantiphila TaxID=3163295 RepID=A0ABW8YNC4_9SPHN
MIRTVALAASATAALFLSSSAFAQTGPCAKAAALDQEVSGMHVKYNSLTANSQAAQKQALKAQIIAKTNELNAAKTQCNQCNAALKTQEVAISDMHKLYNTLTANSQAAQKQQLKAQIIAATNKLDRDKKACN